ncbi:MAG: hypothetical protein A2016_03875 [Elusimicrobia bacterium GWF2_62_30]|nr:MAG: hypothetical protein A2016_03875 [Elusimicrobia bacterium GWF2_62_30]
MNKILVVEDDPSIMEMLKYCLESQGYMIISAENGKTALNWVKEGNIDLAIIDLGLPDMNGMEVCRTIKDNPRTRATPVIILTGNSSNEARIESRLVANANLFLNKPIDAGDLRKAVSKMFEKSEREKRLLRTSIKFRLDGRLSQPGKQP